MAPKKEKKLTMVVQSGHRKIPIDDNVSRWEERKAEIEAGTSNWESIINSFCKAYPAKAATFDYYNATPEEMKVAQYFLWAGLEFCTIKLGLNKDDLNSVDMDCYSRRWKRGQSHVSLQWNVKAVFKSGGLTASGETRPYLKMKIKFVQKKASVVLDSISLETPMEFHMPDFLGCNIKLLVGGKPFNNARAGEIKLNGSALVDDQETSLKDFTSHIQASKFCNDPEVRKAFQGFSSSMGSTQLSLVRGTLLGLADVKNKSADVTCNGNRVYVGVPGTYGSRGDVFIISFKP